MRWEVGQGVRCDLVAYAGPNLSGKRQVMQLYPTGARRGRIDEEVRSMVIRAFPGTRIVLCASNRDAWELAAWRCIRILEGSSLASEQRNGLRGVRVPDLGVYDAFDAKRTDPDVQQGFPHAERLEDGQGWTFGHGDVSKRVAMIRVEREDRLVQPTTDEAALVAVLEALRREHPEAVETALEAAVAVLGEAARHRLGGS